MLKENDVGTEGHTFSLLRTIMITYKQVARYYTHKCYDYLLLCSERNQHIRNETYIQIKEKRYVYSNERGTCTVSGIDPLMKKYTVYGEVSMHWHRNLKKKNIRTLH